MLRYLRIRRLAVIDAVEVEFRSGFNVLTGETGAGKSMLVEAVGLLLGGRASGDLVRTGEQAATIEAVFENGADELLIRREITAQGRSRAFVNGTLATAGALKDLSSQLVELHGQHEHQTLLDPGTHLAALDAFGRLQALVEPTRTAFEQLRAAADGLTQARRQAADRSSREELLTFQVAELDRAGLKAVSPDLPSEDVELASRRQVLASAERIERLCAESYAALYESDQAVLGGLGGVWRRLGELVALDARFQPYLDARDGIKAQLEDLALFLRRYTEGIDASPARLQQVEERLALLERLKRKYGPTLVEVIERRNALRRELSEIQQGEERAADLEREHSLARQRYLNAASALSQGRRRAAPGLAAALEGLAADLAMERTRFEMRLELEPLDESAWAADGIDRGELFVSPNLGEELRPLARIVSGGELSRIMLAIKTLTAGARHGFSEAPDREPSPAAPGLIFDEVDAGIGGRVADVVGAKLRALGSAFQVLCITHLPQIAAYGDAHFAIEKRVDGGRTRTTVRQLDAPARVEELARMLGGAGLTEAVRATAREMLVSRQGREVATGAKGEPKPKGESERTPRAEPMQTPRNTERTARAGTQRSKR